MSNKSDKPNLYASLLERFADQLRDSEMQNTMIQLIVEPILQSTVFKKLRITLYGIVTLLVIIMTLLTILTIQLTLYVFARTTLSRD